MRKTEGEEENQELIAKIEMRKKALRPNYDVLRRMTHRDGFKDHESEGQAFKMSFSKNHLKHGVTFTKQEGRLNKGAVFQGPELTEAPGTYFYKSSRNRFGEESESEEATSSKTSSKPTLRMTREQFNEIQMKENELHRKRENRKNIEALARQFSSHSSKDAARRNQVPKISFKSLPQGLNKETETSESEQVLELSPNVMSSYLSERIFVKLSSRALDGFSGRRRKEQGNNKDNIIPNVEEDSSDQAHSPKILIAQGHPDINSELRKLTECS